MEEFNYYEGFGVFPSDPIQYIHMAPLKKCEKNGIVLPINSKYCWHGGGGSGGSLIFIDLIVSMVALMREATVVTLLKAGLLISHITCPSSPRVTMDIMDIPRQGKHALSNSTCSNPTLWHVSVGNHCLMLSTWYFFFPIACTANQ